MTWKYLHFFFKLAINIYFDNIYRYLWDFLLNHRLNLSIDYIKKFEIF